MSLLDYLMTKRQTGRTTKLLKQAIKLAKQGRAVYVICKNTAHKEHTRMMLRRMTRGHEMGIKFETEESLGSQINWNRLTLHGAHPNVVALFDHALIEDYIHGALRYLDQQEKEPEVSDEEIGLIINHVGRLY